jgi:esterase/lipase superfamily enzyme
MRRIASCPRRAAGAQYRAILLISAGLSLLPSALAQLAEIPDSGLLLKVTVVGPRNQPLHGAEIRLDDRVLGLTDETGVFYLPRKPLDAGPHALSASLAGFETRKQTVEVPADAALLPIQVRFQLRTFIPKPPETIGTPVPNYRVVEIFYATDRRSSRSQDPETYYGGDRSANGALELGTCNISIPASHRKGQLETPSVWHLEFQFDPDKHIFLRLPQPAATDKFYGRLSSRVGQSKRKEAFVFIHGYNTSFAQAARKTAQLAADLDFDGPPILYSWPSLGMFRGYFDDEKNVEWSVPHLQAFLEQIAQKSGASRVHLIAHSMGNRAMSRALQEIGRAQHPGQTPHFQQIVLAAPDIRVNQIQQLELAMLPLGKRVTLYASHNDDALILARILDGVARAGERIHDVVVPGMDAVDASAVRTDFLGHGYFAASTTVIADLKQLLMEDAGPASRRLQPARLADLLYWIIPAAAAEN